MSVPPLSLFSHYVCPQSQIVYGNHHRIMPQRHDDFYNQQVHHHREYYQPYQEDRRIFDDPQHYVDIQYQNPQQSRYISPFETMNRYERTAPINDDYFSSSYQYFQQPVEKDDDMIPIPMLDFKPPPQQLEFTVRQTQLPKGYVELDRKRYYEQQYQDDLKRQVQYGYKSQSKAKRSEVTKYYNNLKVSYDIRGYISINNYEYPTVDDTHSTQPNNQNQTINKPTQPQQQAQQQQQHQNQNNPYLQQQPIQFHQTDSFQHNPEATDPINDSQDSIVLNKLGELQP